jgi:dienelactone hydrolase
MKTISYLALFLLLMAAHPQGPAAPAQAQAQTFLQDLASGKYPAAEAMCNAQVRAKAPAAALQRLWRMLVQSHGPYRSLGATAMLGTAQGVNVTQTDARFARGAVGLRVAVNGGGRIAGLFLVPPSAVSRKPRPAAKTLPGWSPPPYARPARFHEIKVTVGRAPWALPGFLTLPNGRGPVPAVLLVAGSGPEDADETIGPNQPFKDLAWGLASRGIAVLRYPKRTYEYPRQCAALPDFTVKQEYEDDAWAGLALLAARPDIAHGQIFVLGHSEGGMVAPRIAASPLAAGMIALAGSAQPLQRSLVMQVKYLASLHPPRATPAMVERAEGDARAIESPALKPGMRVALLGARLPASYVLDLRGYDPPRAAAALHKPGVRSAKRRSGRRRVEEFPSVGQPSIEVGGGHGRQVHEQLGEVALRIDAVAEAGAGEAGQDGHGAAAARVADEEGVLAVQHHALHFPLGHVVVDGHGAVVEEHAQRFPLVEGVVYRLGHGVLGQQF